MAESQYISKTVREACNWPS